MLFFSNAPVVPSSIDKDQYGKLIEFKDWCKDNGIINSFDSTEDFIKSFRNQLGIIMNENQYILQLIGNDTEGFYSENQKEDDTVISEDAQQLLKEISQDSNGRLVAVMTLGGYIVQTNGKSFGPREYNARVIAQLNSAIEDLEKYGLIRASSKLRDMFTITAKGYEVADKLA